MNDTFSANSSLELLAPAGSMACLEAALGAGADAVYFGLRELNARRGAENFAADELAHLVELIHGRHAKAYLTLNIDLAERELGLAARYLELARKSMVDAVLVRDPAILKLIPYYKGLDFHFSTQAGISTSEGMLAAKKLGISRVVLARELSLEEIRACASVPGIETEVFVQGALCFSVSGRCLLSSWIGGRSGNRGLCASPCRFKWHVKGGQKSGNYMSMNDLSLHENLRELASAGVKALKIEGRLKSPEWVAKAVKTYRGLIDGTPPENIGSEIKSLGDYTGRTMSSGYFKAVRSGLTGGSGRAKSDDSQPCATEPAPPDAAENISVEVRTAGNRFEWILKYDGSSHSISLPMKVIHNQSRAVALLEAEVRIRQELERSGTALRWKTDSSGQLISRSSLNNIIDEISAFIHRCKKGVTEKLNVPLPPEVKLLLERKADHKAVAKTLGGKPDRIRISCKQYLRFMKELAGFQPIITDAGASDVNSLEGNPVVALPTVFYENDIGHLRELVQACVEKGFGVEVNSWDGWHLAEGQGGRMEAGPGLMVLNSIAAEFLHEKRCESVTISIEAGKEQICEIRRKTDVPLSLYVYGRPALMITRAELSEDLAGGNAVLRDSRGFEIKASLEDGLALFRPVDPFNISGISDPEIQAAHLVADLEGAGNPPDDLKMLGKKLGRDFNYSGKLK